jgi:hypothetical protein
MTPALKLLSKEKTDWEQTLALYQEQLRCCLDYLVQCECDYQILTHVEAEVRERSVPDEFKLRFLVRTLVQNVIHHLRVCAHPKPDSHCPAQDPSSSIAETPYQERLVYFMRDILGYSKRDTSLLIGVTDAQVEELLSFARKRIEMTEAMTSLFMRRNGAISDGSSSMFIRADSNRKKVGHPGVFAKCR